MCVRVCGCLKMPAEGTWSLRARVAGICELLSVSMGIWTLSWDWTVTTEPPLHPSCPCPSSSPLRQSSYSVGLTGLELVMCTRWCSGLFLSYTGIKGITITHTKSLPCLKQIERKYIHIFINYIYLYIIYVFIYLIYIRSQAWGLALKQKSVLLC